jgi:iron complex transport system substrate-binding protein
VGDAVRVDIEQVMALSPDLVLAWRSGNQAGDVERLERLGYRVFVTEAARLADVGRLLRLIGTLAGSAAEAGRAAAAFEREARALEERYGARAVVRVFYAVWHRPLVTVSGAHMISDVFRLCGGRNVFADLPARTAAVSLEAVLAARPQVILGGARAGGDEEFFREWRAMAVGELRALPAYYVNPDHLQRQTPRLIEGARAVCAALEEVRARRH